MKDFQSGRTYQAVNAIDKMTVTSKGTKMLSYIHNGERRRSKIRYDQGVEYIVTDGYDGAPEFFANYSALNQLGARPQIK